jgi:hypothetical protein
MAKRKPKAAQEEQRPLLICNGQFLVVTKDNVQVHLLSDTATTLFYDGLLIAEQTSQPEMYVAQVLRQTFRVDVVTALPAGSIEALYFYIEHYNGPQQEKVKQLAACIVTGTPYGPEENPPMDDGGIRERVPVKPLAPTGGGAIDYAAESQALAIESMQR